MHVRRSGADFWWGDDAGDRHVGYVIAQILRLDCRQFLAPRMVNWGQKMRAKMAIGGRTTLALAGLMAAVASSASAVTITFEDAALAPNAPTYAESGISFGYPHSLTFFGGGPFPAEPDIYGQQSGIFAEIGVGAEILAQDNRPFVLTSLDIASPYQAGGPTITGFLAYPDRYDNFGAVLITIETGPPFETVAIPQIAAERVVFLGTLWPYMWYDHDFTYNAQLLLHGYGNTAYYDNLVITPDVAPAQLPPPGPPAVVPEPGTWALMLVGVGLVGWKRRHLQPAAGAMTLN